MSRNPALPRATQGARRTFDPFVLLVLLFSLFPIGPLLQPGYPWTAHDARHSVYFLFEFDRGIQDGIPYPRWQPDFAFGYGYPFFNIYGPLSTYIGEAFYLLGLGFTGAVKATFALSVVGSGLAMYAFVKRVLGRQAGLVAAVAYMVIPYRLVDLYVRAALAESVAYVFIPLVLWGAWATLHRPRLANVVGLAFAYAGLMLTSPLVTLLVTVILTCYVAALALARVNDQQAWRYMSRESILPLLGHLAHLLLPTAAGLAMGLGLSAVFALPAMTENRFVRLDQWYGGRYAWGGDFVEFFQLFSPQWGFGASVPGPEDQVSFQLGVVPVVLSLLAFASLVRFKARETLSRPGVRLVAFFAVVTAVAVFLMVGLSAPLWQALPLVRLVQFPWRLLTVTVVSISFLCGSVVQVQATEGQKTLRFAQGDSGGKPAPEGSGPFHRSLSSAQGDRVPPTHGTNQPMYTTVAVVALLILGSLPYMRAEMSERSVSMADLMRFQQSADEMTGSTAWVREIPRWSPLADYHIAGKPVTSRVNYRLLFRQPGRPRAQTLAMRAQSELVEYSAERPVLVTFNLFYYPGWHAYRVDANTGAVLEELPIASRGELGLVTVRVPSGVGHLLLRFEDTPVRKMGTAMSFGSLALIAALLLVRIAWRGRKPRQRAGGLARPR